jgi:hypothetical protein
MYGLAKETKQSNLKIDDTLSNFRGLTYTGPAPVQYLTKMISETKDS